jgi:hypothetical protein
MMKLYPKVLNQKKGTKMTKEIHDEETIRLLQVVTDFNPNITTTIEQGVAILGSNFFPPSCIAEILPAALYSESEHTKLRRTLPAKPILEKILLSDLLLIAGQSVEVRLSSSRRTVPDVISTSPVCWYVIRKNPFCGLFSITDYRDLTKKITNSSNIIMTNAEAIWCATVAIKSAAREQTSATGLVYRGEQIPGDLGQFMRRMIDDIKTKSFTPFAIKLT